MSLPHGLGSILGYARIQIAIVPDMQIDFGVDLSHFRQLFADFAQPSIPESRAVMIARQPEVMPDLRIGQT